MLLVKKITVCPSAALTVSASHISAHLTQRRVAARLHVMAAEPVQLHAPKLSQLDGISMSQLLQQLANMGIDLSQLRQQMTQLLVSCSEHLSMMKVPLLEQTKCAFGQAVGLMEFNQHQRCTSSWQPSWAVCCMADNMPVISSLARCRLRMVSQLCMFVIWLLKPMHKHK